MSHFDIIHSFRRKTLCVTRSSVCRLAHHREPMMVNGSELKEVMWVVSQSHESEWTEFLSVVVRWYRNDVFSFTARGAMYAHINTQMAENVGLRWRLW